MKKSKSKTVSMASGKKAKAKRSGAGSSAPRTEVAPGPAESFDSSGIQPEPSQSKKCATRKRKSTPSKLPESPPKKRQLCQEERVVSDENAQTVTPVILDVRSLQDCDADILREFSSDIAIKTEPVEEEEEEGGEVPATTSEANLVSRFPICNSLLTNQINSSDFSLVRVKTEPSSEEGLDQSNDLVPDMDAIQQSIVMVQCPNVSGGQTHMPVMLVNPSPTKLRTPGPRKGPARSVPDSSKGKKNSSITGAKPRQTAQSLLRNALSGPLGGALYTCDICGKHFSSEAAWQRHALNHSVIGRGATWACGICGSAFEDEKSLLEHDRECSGNRNCHFCGEFFASDDDRLEHIILNHPEVSILKETDDDLYKCGTCLRNFNSTQTLLNHLQSHQGDRPFKCNICHKAFRQAGDVTRHMRTHTGDRPFSCDFCNKTFRTSGNLQEHCRIHSGIKPFPCDVCGKRFARSTGLTIHMRSHSGIRPYECNLCHRRFSQAGGLVHHMSTHTKLKPYRCEVCGRQFSWKYHLQSHMMIHSGEKPYECKVCHKRFRQSSTRQKHMRLHTTPNTFSCQICWKTFSNVTTCQVHMRSHSLEKPFECDVCHVKFSLHSSLQIHQRSHTRDKPFKCPTCDESFAEEMGLQLHECSPMGKASEQNCNVTEQGQSDPEERPRGLSLAANSQGGEQNDLGEEVPLLVNIKTEPMSPNSDLEGIAVTSNTASLTEASDNHSSVLTAMLATEPSQILPILNLPLSEWSSPNKLSCHLCLKGFTQEKHLAKHMEIHNPNRPHECAVCHKRFHHQADVSRHMRIHTNEKPYECTVCHKRFRTSGNMNEHKRIHSKTKFRPYTCNVCGKGFKTTGSLNTHMDIHSGRRPHMCNLCGKCFRQAGDLHRHFRIHTGDRPYECSLCDAKFKTSGNLHDHMKIHSGTKPHACNFCHRAFRQTSTLRKHLRIHSSGTSLFECTLCDRIFNWENSLEIHMKNNHSGEKRHTCPRCGTSFMQEFSLRAHMDSRNCEQKKCNKCGKCFALEMKLRHHVCRPPGGNPQKSSSSVSAPIAKSKNLLPESTPNIFDLLGSLVDGMSAAKTNKDTDELQDNNDHNEKMDSPEKSASKRQSSIHKASVNEMSNKDEVDDENDEGLSAKDDSSHLWKSPNAGRECFVKLEKLTDAYVQYRTSRVEHRSISIEELAKLLPPPPDYESDSSSSGYDLVAVEPMAGAEGAGAGDGLNSESAGLAQIKLEPVSFDELTLEPEVTFPSMVDAGQSAAKEMVRPPKATPSRKKVPTETLVFPASNHLAPEGSEARFKCPECTEEFENANGLLCHLMTHTDKMEKTRTAYQCSICQKSFSQPSNLARHLDIHSGDRPYDCTVCGKSFRQAGDVVRHMRIHTGARPYECKICSKRFRNSGNLQEHYRIHTGYKPHQCNECGKCFNRGTALRIHMRVHKGAKAYKCKMCYQSFSKQSALTQHMAVHSKERRFKCNICGKLFGYSYHLQGHMLIHTGDKPFVCKLCGKSFRQSSTLTKHMRVHSGEKPHKCHYCTKCYSSNAALYLHLSYHERGQEEFKCDLCGEVFFRSSNLLNHACRLRTKSVCNCKLCGAVFTRMFDLERHVCTTIKDSVTDAALANPEALVSEAVEMSLLGREATASPQDSEQNVLVNSDGGGLEFSASLVPQIKEEPASCDLSISDVRSCATEVSESSPSLPVSSRSTPSSSSSSRIRAILLGTKSVGYRSAFEHPPTCKVCKAVFDSHAALASHMVQHGSEVPQCYICSATFRLAQSFPKHMLTKHSTQDWVKCDQCLCFFPTVEDRWNHHCAGLCGDPLKCPCGREVKDVRTYGSHWETHPDFEVRLCILCSRMFFSVDTLLKHVQTHVTGGKPEIRTARPKSTSAGSEKSRPGVAVKSRKSRPSVSAVPSETQEDVNHKEPSPKETSSQSMETDENSSSASVHKNASPPRSSKKSRKSVAESSAPQDPASSSIEPQSTNDDADGKRYRCSVCRTFSRSQQTLEFHMERIHSTINQCPICQKKCLLPKSLKKHVRLHKIGKLHTCPVCKQTFSFVYELKAHWAGMTCSGFAPFNCACQKTFESIEDYSAHLISHADDAVYRCTICFMNFGYRQSLKKHMRHKHARPWCGRCHKMYPLGSRNHVCPSQRRNPKGKDPVKAEEPSEPSRYSCDLCKQVFQRAFDLQVHKCVPPAWKLTTYRYKCSFCTYRYNTKEELRQHERVHLPKTQPGEDATLPYICGRCGSGFSEIVNLHFHSLECNSDAKDALAASSTISGAKGSKPRPTRRMSAAASSKTGNGSGGGDGKTAKVTLHQCPYCVKKFKSSFLLKQHVPNHYQDLFYNCQLCGRDYQHRSTLKRHLKTAHPEVTDMEPLLKKGSQERQVDQEVIKIERIDPDYEKSLIFGELGQGENATETIEDAVAAVSKRSASRREVQDPEDSSQSDIEPRLVIAEAGTSSQDADSDPGLVISAVVGGDQSEALLASNDQSDVESNLLLTSVVGACDQSGSLQELQPDDSDVPSELVIAQVVGSSALADPGSEVAEDEGNQSGLVITTVMGGVSEPESETGFVISEVRGGVAAELETLQNLEASAEDSVDENSQHGKISSPARDELRSSLGSPNPTDSAETKARESEVDDGSRTFSTPSAEERRVTKRKRAKIFRCQICGKRFTQQSSLDFHRQAHKKKYQCKECGKKFNFCVKLQEHMLSHGANALLFTCSKCGISFRQLSEFQQHSCSA